MSEEIEEEKRSDLSGLGCPGIGELLPLVMRDIGAIGKNKANNQQNYFFRGVDDVLNTVSPACVKHNVRVECFIVESQHETIYPDETKKAKYRVSATLKMRLKFTAPDGSNHTSEAIGQAFDYNGDKAFNKAMSAAFKYACFLGLVIPVEGILDDSDTDGSNAKFDRNGKCGKWEDWITAKGAKLGEVVDNDNIPDDEKRSGLATIKANLERHVSKSETDEEQYSYERDLDFVNEALSIVENRLIKQ